MHHPDQLYDIGIRHLSALREEAQGYRYVQEGRAVGEKLVLKVQRPDTWYGGLRFALLVWLSRPLKGELVR